MYSLNGTGTTLYGKSDIDSRDGSYVATKWFIFLLFPIIPFGSYRVWRGETKTKFFLPGYETQYRTIRVKTNWKQVIKTYLFFWVLVPFVIIFLLYLLGGFTI